MNKDIKYILTRIIDYSNKCYTYKDEKTVTIYIDKRGGFCMEKIGKIYKDGQINVVNYTLFLLKY